jgi:hypothetical protein
MATLLLYALSFMEKYAIFQAENTANYPYVGIRLI